MLVPFGLGSLEFASYTVRSVLTKPCYYILALLLSEVHMGVHIAWLGFYRLISCLLLTSRAVEHVVDPASTNPAMENGIGSSQYLFSRILYCINICSGSINKV
jgi:hypothetical protein